MNTIKMKSVFPGLCIALCLLCAAPPLSLADGTPEMAALEATLAKLLPADGPGEAVLVARDGKILFSHAYGLADREKQMPATPETRFRIGSVTKQFTAAAILHLVQEGKLSIEDTLAKYFPSYPGGDKITLRQLLNHTSGLHNYTAHPDFLTRVIHPIAPADLVAWFQNDPSDFPPGEQFRYCNTGYVLLGQIVEKVSGLSLGDYLQKQFFGPLGMHDTGVWQNATPPGNAAKGYSLAAGTQLQPALEWDMSWAGGAGELYSTTGDLWRWTEALQEGKVLSPEGLRAMTTEFTVPKKRPSRCATAWASLMRKSSGFRRSDTTGGERLSQRGDMVSRGENHSRRAGERDARAARDDAGGDRAHRDARISRAGDRGAHAKNRYRRELQKLSGLCGTL